MISWYLQHCPIHSGKSHLYRMFRDRVARQGPYVCQYDGGLEMKVDLTDKIQENVFLYRCYRKERRHQKFMLSLVRPGDTVLDIGAHIGYYTASFAKRVGPGGRVFAFEPNPVNYSRLVDHLKRNQLDNVTALNCAASDEKGTGTLHLHSRNTGMASLHPHRFAEPAGEVETVVPDQILAEAGAGPVALIKIDVEGHELGVIRGLRATLDRPPGDCPRVFVEVSERSLARAGQTSADLFQLMDELGYRPFRIGPREAVPAEGPFSDSLVLFQKG